MVLNYGQLGGNRVLTPESVVSLGLNHVGDCRVTGFNSFTKLANDAEFSRYEKVMEFGVPDQS